MSVLLDNEISKLKKSILVLCGMVENAVADAVDAVMTSNQEKAENVIRNDIEIDHFELDVEEECLKILALHQPVAGDLRYVIACLKMNNDLERIGDLAVNIAKRALSYYAISSEEKIPVNLRPLCECTKNALSMSLDALIKLDADLANQGIAYDDVIDDMNRENHAELLRQIAADHSLIAFFKFMILNLSAQLSRSFSGLCKNHQTSHRTVQPMYGCKIRFFISLLLFKKIMLQIGFHIYISTGIRLYRHPRRLFAYQNAVILEYNRNLFLPQHLVTCFLSFRRKLPFFFDTF